MEIIPPIRTWLEVVSIEVSEQFVVKYPVNLSFEEEEPRTEWTA